MLHLNHRTHCVLLQEYCILPPSVLLNVASLQGYLELSLFGEWLFGNVKATIEAGELPSRLAVVRSLMADFPADVAALTTGCYLIGAVLTFVYMNYDFGQYVDDETLGLCVIAASKAFAALRHVEDDYLYAVECLEALGALGKDAVCRHCVPAQVLSYMTVSDTVNRPSLLSYYGLLVIRALYRSGAPTSKLSKGFCCSLHFCERLSQGLWINTSTLLRAPPGKGQSFLALDTVLEEVIVRTALLSDVGQAGAYRWNMHVDLVDFWRGGSQSKARLRGHAAHLPFCQRV